MGILRNFGHVMVDLGPDRRREPVGDNGQAYFPAIPASFRGQKVDAWLDADGYELVSPGMQRALDGDSLYLAVRKTAGRLAGRVQDEEGRPIAGALLSVAGTSTASDATGYFELTIPPVVCKESCRFKQLPPALDRVIPTWCLAATTRP
jgi:hypothetical protein